MKGIEGLLQQLEKENINYVHWKSNTNIKDALKGVDDLDILVDSKDKDQYKIHSLRIGKLSEKIKKLERLAYENKEKEICKPGSLLLHSGRWT